MIVQTLWRREQRLKARSGEKLPSSGLTSSRRARCAPLSERRQKWRHHPACSKVRFLQISLTAFLPSTLSDLRGEGTPAVKKRFWKGMVNTWQRCASAASMQVYLISKGRVKPANRSFSTARNDYTIDFSNECAATQILAKRPSRSAESEIRGQCVPRSGSILSQTRLRGGPLTAGADGDLCDHALWMQHPYRRGR